MRLREAQRLDREHCRAQRIFLPSSEASRLDAEAGRAVALVEDRVHLDELGGDAPARCRPASPWPGGPRGRRCPPGEGVPTPGACSGSMPSRSKLTWMPAVPLVARLIASSITVRMPRSSMSRMVKAPMPDVLDVLRARRRPRRAGRPPPRARRRPWAPRRPGRPGSARPSPARPPAGMPWMLPLGDVSGVFMSPWASNQMSPIFWPRSRWKRETPAIVPIAIEWSPPSTTGMRPLASARAHPVAQRLAGGADLAPGTCSRGSPGSLRLLDRRPSTSPASRRRSPASRSVWWMSASRKADGPMSTPRRPAPRSRGTPMNVTVWVMTRGR